MSGKIASRPLIIMAGAAMALSGVGVYAWHDIHRPKVLEVYVFDLPGAPGIFIRTPNDKRVLINGGSNTEIVKYITDILPFYSRRIDTIIVTSPDSRNVTGLIDVLNRYEVGEVILPGITLGSLGLASSTDQIYKVFEETIRARNVSIKKAVAGNRLILDAEDADNVVSDILFPVEPSEFKYSKASSPELLMRINYGSTSVVLMGSATAKVQRFIAVNNELPANALIYFHSTVASNISRELIDSLAPESIVYSQAITKASSKTNKKAEADPLAGVLNEHRFNLKRSGVVKIVSDGTQIKID